MEHFGPKAAQMLQMVSFGTIFYDFRPEAPQILQMVSFGTSFVHFKPKTAQKFQMVSLEPFWTISGPRLSRCFKCLVFGVILDNFGSKGAHGLSFERALHSK